MRRKVAAERDGGIVETRDEIGAKARRDAAFDLIQYGVGESLAEVAVPVGLCLAQMRDRRQRVEGRVPRRRHSAIGDARMVEIEREIVGYDAPVNVAQQPLVAIGRASCRERVCQYVSISVVAVSLNKKK